MKNFILEFLDALFLLLTIAVMLVIIVMMLSSIIWLCDNFVPVSYYGAPHGHLFYNH
jgi:hypothetical protein